MPNAEDVLRATLSDNEFAALEILAQSSAPLSGRKVAAALGVSPTTANDALATLRNAGFAVSRAVGRAIMWTLTTENSMISAWLAESAARSGPESAGSSPYSTGGGGVRLEHAYAASLVARFLAGEPIGEFRDSIVPDTVRLQASDVSPVDDIVLEGVDEGGTTHRTSISVRRAPALTASDTSSVPLFRSFLRVVTDHWREASLGIWRLTLAVSSNANAITQLQELCNLAASLPSGAELERRLAQPGRTNHYVRDRYGNIKKLVQQASLDLEPNGEIGDVDLTWRLLSSLSVRQLRFERTDRTDRTHAVTALQRAMSDGTPAAADALFSRLEELVGEWASQGAVLTQAVVRRSLGDTCLARSARFAAAWPVLDRLGARLRESVRPELRVGPVALEFERSSERERLKDVLKSAGSSAGTVVVTGDPDLGKSALALRAVEQLAIEGASVTCLTLGDLPRRLTEFESELGDGIDDILAASETRPTRLLLIDGAEAVLQGKAQLFRSLATAALRAGIGVVAVTRTDGAKQVRQELVRASELAGTTGSLVEHGVAPLSQDEIAALPTHFSALARLSGDAKSRWLLGRLGLVDAVLRTGREFAPGELLCEADVYEAVWNSLVRRNEGQPSGAASSDDREHAALEVARRVLGLRTGIATGTSLSELRSDGLLVAPRSLAASNGDQFASDLFRDFALCRNFTVDGWHSLFEVGAPRWAIRSARLAAQVSLMGTERAEAWVRLTETFDEIAAAFGERWREVPLEALLTRGDAEAALRELWPQLASGNGKALTMLIGLAETRYIRSSVGDPFALAPIIQVVFCEGRSTPPGIARGYRRGGEIVRDLVLAWLRGAAAKVPDPSPLRQAVRDTILANDPALHDEFAVEALALLGPDLDEPSEAWLCQVAAQRPSHLSRAVESAAVAVSMSLAKPQLLLQIAEAYYIDQPDPEAEWYGYDLTDDGIRDFQHGLGFGFGAPGAAWYYGPFFRLLNTIPAEAIAFINRMLDHAANVRVRKLERYADDLAHNDTPQGVALDLLGLGERHYVGDSHVWSWYRGSTVGPYACMSALLALERFSDHLLERLHLPIRGIAEALLRSSNSLSMPGLVYGFLVRHIDQAGDLLDSFLEQPDVWELETGRVVSEHFSVRDPDADRLTGKERRSHTPHHTVAEMVIQARLRNDDGRLTKLADVGAALLERARVQTADEDPDAERIAVVEGWASQFRFDNYSATATDDGVLIQFERPPEIERVLAAGDRELQSVQAMYRLQHRYAIHNDSPQEWPIDTLAEDLAVARELQGDDAVPPDHYGPENPLAAVAGAAVRAHAMGAAALDAGDLAWAIDAILSAALKPSDDGFGNYSGSMFVMGADRAAAASVPLLLLKPFDSLVDGNLVQEALQALARSGTDEVRAILVKGLEPVWHVSCEMSTDTGLCSRHWPAWVAATAGLAAARLGPWSSQHGRRLIDPLQPPYYATLLTVSEDDILVEYLRPPLEVMVDVRQLPCLTKSVARMWSPLWETYRRGLLHSWSGGYDRHAHRTHEPIASRMIATWAEGDKDILATYIRTFSQNANALHLLFDGFSRAFTYDAGLRAHLPTFWPWALRIALDALGDGRPLRGEDRWFDYMVAALLPTPTARPSESDIDSLFQQARRTWLQPESLDALADRWIALSRGEPKAVDAVVKFARSAPYAWQSSGALNWIEQLIDGRFDRVANQLWYLEEWITELRKTGLLTDSTRAQYHRIVDGLAAAGDRAAVRLQELDE